MDLRRAGLRPTAERAMSKIIGNVFMILAFAACFVILFWVVTGTSSVDAGKLGPTLKFAPWGGDAKTLVNQASMGYSEQPGFIRVSGVWYKIHWRFGDKRIEFHRTLAPTGTATCMTWGAPDDED